MPDDEPFAERRSGSALPTMAEIRAAIAYETRFGARAERVEALENGALFVPAVGLALGAAIAAIDLALGAAPLPLRSFLTILTLEVLRGYPHPAPISYEQGLRIAKWAALAVTSAGRFPVLLFAPMLGGWGAVVCAFGARDAAAPGTGRKFARGITFREFSLASVFSFAVVMAVNEAVGVALVLSAAAITVGLRVIWHRYFGGVTERRLRLTGDAVETCVLAIFAVLSHG